MGREVSEFYAADVVYERLEASLPIGGIEQQDSKPVQTSLLATIAAVVATGVLVFGPCAGSVGSGQIIENQSTVVRVQIRAMNDVPHVVAPVAYQSSAEHFRKLFRAVPLAASEKLPDPDRGI